MKTILIILLTFLISTIAFSSGKIDLQKVKNEADVVRNCLMAITGDLPSLFILSNDDAFKYYSEWCFELGKSTIKEPVDATTDTADEPIKMDIGIDEIDE